MKKYLIAGLLSAVSVSSFSNNPYIGVDYSVIDAELSENGTRGDSNPTAVNLKVGSYLNNNVAIEFLVGGGLGDDRVENSNFDLELDSMRNISLVGVWPSQGFNLYGKVGYAEIEYDDSDGDSASATGMTFGVGIGFDITQSTGLSLEYIKYPDGDYDSFDIDIEAGAFNLGFYYKF